MARGNQRDKAREATQKKLASQVSPHRVQSSQPDLPVPLWPHFPGPAPKLLSAQRAGLQRGPALPSRAAATDFTARENKTAPCTALLTSYPRFPATQKSKNNKTGSEMQRDKEQVAAMMREKQKAGKALSPGPVLRNDSPLWRCGITNDLTIMGSTSYSR